MTINTSNLNVIDFIHQLIKNQSISIDYQSISLVLILINYSFNKIKTNQIPLLIFIDSVYPRPYNNSTAKYSALPPTTSVLCTELPALLST